MKEVSSFLKSNRTKILKSLKILLFFSAIIVGISLLFSPSPDTRVIVNCTKLSTDDLRCRFRCGFQTNLTNATTRIVINHNPWCAIYDKTLHNVTSVDFALPKRNFHYQIWVIINENEHFAIYEGRIKC